MLQDVVTFLPFRTLVLIDVDSFGDSCAQSVRIISSEYAVYVGCQLRNFFISYLFFRHFVGQALRNVCYSGITFLVTK